MSAGLREEARAVGGPAATQREREKRDARACGSVFLHRLNRLSEVAAWISSVNIRSDE